MSSAQLLVALCVVLIVVIVFYLITSKRKEHLTSPDMASGFKLVVGSPFSATEVNFINSVRGDTDWKNFLKGKLSLSSIRQIVANNLVFASALKDKCERISGISVNDAASTTYALTAINNYLYNYNIKGPLVGVKTPLTIQYPNIGADLLGFAVDLYDNYEEIKTAGKGVIPLYNNLLEKNNLFQRNGKQISGNIPQRVAVMVNYIHDNVPSITSGNDIKQLFS